MSDVFFVIGVALILVGAVVSDGFPVLAVAMLAGGFVCLAVFAVMMETSP